MRVFLDACIDPRVADLFVGHEVTTAFELGWHQVKDHILLALLHDRFDVVVTIDQGMEHEHNLKKLSFGLVIVHVPKNKAEFYRPLRLELRDAVERARPGEVIHVHGKQPESW
jgi:predicted nuclease of predicted toxin-antitoxin system